MYKEKNGIGLILVLNHVKNRAIDIVTLPLQINKEVLSYQFYDAKSVLVAFKLASLHSSLSISATIAIHNMRF
jgi:hypothetical protein